MGLKYPHTSTYILSTTTSGAVRSNRKDKCPSSHDITPFNVFHDKKE